MGRLLGEEIKNLLRIKDPISGDEIGLFYRIPTTEEKGAYYTSIWDRTKNEVKENLTSARLEWGEKILEGLAEGSFSHKVNGEIKNISSDPESEGYLSDWKSWVIKYAPDLLEILAAQIFENLAETRITQEGPPEKK